MASDKQKRKAAKKSPVPGKPFVHPDGDRRRRGGPNVDQAIRDKRTRQTFAGGVPEDLPPPKPAADEPDDPLTGCHPTKSTTCRSARSGGGGGGS